MHILKTFLFAFAFNSGTFAHWDSAYFRSADDGFNFGRTKWMETICDNTPIRELALPGTHDSGTYKVIGDSISTQCLNFAQQMSAGIRVFDIRVRHIENKFTLQSGTDDLNVAFSDFLLEVALFLTNQTSETVLFRLKKEYIDGTGNTRSMRATLDWYLNLYQSFYLNTTNLGVTLGQARGKFIVLNDNGDFNGVGIGYGNLDIQDEYSLGSNWDLYGKWEKVKTQLGRSKDGAKESWYMNYLSGSGGSFPYFVASGHSSPGTGAPRLATGLMTPLSQNSFPDFPRVFCIFRLCTIAYEGTNILTRDRIKEINQKRWGSRTVGIIMSDYPGDSLISEIIDNNWRICRKQ